MPRVFFQDAPAARSSLSGREGLFFAKKPATKPKDETHQTQAPAFRKGAVKTMTNKQRAEFSKEDVARGEFLDQNRERLAGTKEVNAYEDKEVVAFDPLKDLREEEAGHNTYDSGIHQGGKSSQSFVKPNNVYYGGRPVTLDRPDPYLPKLAPSLKIKM